MRRHTSVLTVACLLVALAACGGSEPESTETTSAGDGASAEGEAEIVIVDFTFTGADTVAVGETLTVTNEDSVGHTWTAEDDQFDSGTLSQGETFEYTFEEAGEFDYVCTIHPQMSGTITVEG